MMKKGIYAFFAVLTVFAMVMAGCSDGDSDSGGGSKTKVTLKQTTLNVDVGKTSYIDVDTDPEEVELTAKSSNESVATVAKTSNPNRFQVNGIFQGNATITITAKDGGNAACAVTVVPATSDYVAVEGETLVHYKPMLRGVNHFGNDLGTTNNDGSYIFDGTAGGWSGGGAQYNFPVSSTNAWSISDYVVAEVFLKVTDGTVNAAFKKSGGNVDLKPYPDAANQVALSSTTPSYKFIIGEAGSGIGFQRNTGGPATVAIEKVVFSKVATHTIKFEGGAAATATPPAWTALPDIIIPTGRTVNFGGSYTMPTRPLWTNHTFNGWAIKEDSNANFITSTAITKDITLVAQWKDGAPSAVDMSLNLNPASWGTLPANSQAVTGGSVGYTIPAEYADSVYENGVLTLTFNGKNRQRAIIPLSKEQIDELLNSTQAGVTFRIVGTVTRGAQGTLTNEQIAAGDLGFAGFRMHLGTPAAGNNWNGTSGSIKSTPLTGNADPADDHLVEYAAIDRRDEEHLGFYMLQAVFRDKDNSNNGLPDNKDNPWAQTFPKVIIKIDSITIDIGDTRN